jgi:hypothetical protein
MATSQLPFPVAATAFILSVMAQPVEPVAAAAAAPAAGGAALECDVSGSAAEPADVSRARAACEAARRRFAGLFGEPAPSVLVILHDSPAYQVALDGQMGLVFWPNSAALGATAAGRGAEGPRGSHGTDFAAGGLVSVAARHSALQWDEVLPHEIAHALTLARFYGGAIIPAHSGYGTPLPDWFEEGIAIWGEPLESRLARVRQALRLPAHRLDLRTILDSAHPAGAHALGMPPMPGAPASRDDALRAFYPQAAAVLAFVHDAGGSAAVRELGRRLMRDPLDPEALAGLTGMPYDMDGVVAAWHRWLADQS